MQDNSMRWLLGALTVVVTLALLFGGQLVWNRYAIAKPIDKMFDSIDGVESVAVDLNEQVKSNERITVRVKLNDVNNLQKLYTDMNKGLEKYGGYKKYDLMIQDDRSPELEHFYYTVHYYIQEAISTGNFAIMAERLQSKAYASEVDMQVYVDTDNIYLHMKKNDKDMYIIIPRFQTKEVR